MRVIVCFQNDAQGLENLELAYQTIAKVILNHLDKDTNAGASGASNEDCGDATKNGGTVS